MFLTQKKLAHILSQNCHREVRSSSQDVQCQHQRQNKQTFKHEQTFVTEKAKLILIAENENKKEKHLKWHLSLRSAPECDIRMDFDMNEYLIIFHSRK